VFKIKGCHDKAKLRERQVFQGPRKGKGIVFFFLVGGSPENKTPQIWNRASVGGFHSTTVFSFEILRKSGGGGGY